MGRFIGLRLQFIQINLWVKCIAPDLIREASDKLWYTFIIVAHAVKLTAESGMCE